MANQTHKLIIPSSTHHLSEVRRFVERYARKANLTDEVVDQFILAVDEACSNVIEHAYAGEATHEIEVAINSTDIRFTVVIRDQGRAFEPQTYRSPNLIELVDRRRDGGFGVHLMLRLMDRVEYRRRGKVNEVALTKYLERASISNGT